MNTELFVNALDAVSDAVLVCDAHGSVVHANRGARELFGAVPNSRADVARHPAWSRAREQHVSGAAVVVIPRTQQQVLPLAERERLAIEQALNESGWQLAIAARKLGISRTTLWRRLKAYRLNRPGMTAAAIAG